MTQTIEFHLITREIGALLKKRYNEKVITSKGRRISWSVLIYKIVKYLKKKEMVVYNDERILC